jgi:hypothetical protein
MLESAKLLFLPWVAAATADGSEPAVASWIRPILDATSQQTLGFARLRTGAGIPWLGWFSRSVVEIRETEDESLLATLHQSWFAATTWQVNEADGHLVGWIRRTILQDLYGRRFAALEPARNQLNHCFVSPQGHELGTLQELSEGQVLTFDLSLENNPFGKMMLLGAGLRAQLPIVTAAVLPKR